MKEQVCCWWIQICRFCQNIGNCCLVRTFSTTMICPGCWHDIWHDTARVWSPRNERISSRNHLITVLVTYWHQHCNTMAHPRAWCRVYKICHHQTPDSSHRISNNNYNFINRENHITTIKENLLSQRRSNVWLGFLNPGIVLIFNNREYVDSVFDDFLLVVSEISGRFEMWTDGTDTDD